MTDLTALTANASPALVDLLYSVDDPAGTPLPRKVTLQSVMDLFEANMTVPTSVSSAYRTSTILASTSTGEGAALIGSEDAGTYYTATTVEGILQELGALLPAGTIVGTSDSQTLINKTVNLASNTLTGTTAEFNTALSDDSFATLTNIVTLTNKTLTSPQVNQLLDTNGNESIVLTATASGVSYLTVASGTTGNDVTLTGSGEANTGVSIQPSGTGNVTVGPIVIDGDATVGAGQDNYVLTYNHAAGTWGPEASGGGTVGISGTPANNQFAVWTDATTVEGISALTYDATSFTITADLDPNADGTINLGNSTNRFASISVDSIDLNGTTFSGTTLADPGVDAGLFWDDSASSTGYFTAGTGLEFSTTNLQIDSTVVQNTGATFSGLINFSGTNHAGLRLITLTTTQRNALTPAAGDVIYNSTTGNIEGYDGSSWLDLGAGAAAGIADVVDDTTPQLGGDLDVNGQAIVSVSAGNIPITPDTTGSIILDGLTWPNADGAANTALTTDGAGTLSFVNLSTRTETLTNKTIDSANNTLTVDLSEATVTGTLAEFNSAVSDASLAQLGANTFTGTQDFNGQQVEGYLNKVVTSVTGALTAADHSGNILKTSGNVTVPTTAGFTCTLIAGGAHTVTFNATTSAAMAAGDVMTVIVESSTVIHAVLTASADKVSFT